MKYKVHRNPLKTNDFQIVEADSYKEEGSFTKFSLDGVEVLALPTQYITSIETIPDEIRRSGSLA